MAENDSLSVPVCVTMPRPERLRVYADYLDKLGKFFSIQRARAENEVDPIAAEGYADTVTACKGIASELRDLAVRQAAPSGDDAALREERAFKAGYHCRWHQGFRTYLFDPALCPGDADGAYAAWLATPAARDAAREETKP